MNKTLTYDNWMKFVTRSMSADNGGMPMSWDSETEFYDITAKFPSLSKLNEYNIDLLNDPFYITNDTDELKRQYVDYEDFEDELKYYTHIHDIKFVRSITAIFQNKIGILIRGVRPTSIYSDMIQRKKNDFVNVIKDEKWFKENNILFTKTSKASRYNKETNQYEDVMGTYDYQYKEVEELEEYYKQYSHIYSIEITFPNKMQIVGVKKVHEYVAK